MNVTKHNELTGKIWEIANLLRGPYRPPQYRLVMLPIIVLRRFDCVLEPTKSAVLKQLKKLEAQQTPEAAKKRRLGEAADPNRGHPLYNISRYTFERLLNDPENIASNLRDYINGFSRNVRTIFERFKFADQIDKLNDNNRLFVVVKAIADVDLHPNRIDNLQMGYLFEHLIMRFNEQANEEAGDHFTPREVIRLMVNLIYTGESDVYTPGIYRTIYDPTCGSERGTFRSRPSLDARRAGRVFAGLWRCSYGILSVMLERVQLLDKYRYFGNDILKENVC